MDYEIVDLEDKIIAGIKIHTSNNDKNMKQQIGQLWQDFFVNGIYQSIPNKINSKSIGLYSNYESDVNGGYDMTVCCEVDNIDNIPSNVKTYKIHSGKYAKFVVYGDMQKAVVEFWEKFWLMELDRKYTYDFEEYQNVNDNHNTEIHIYISIN